ncbi:MAG: hypothetical protein ACI8UO_000844 [Verrucomicrobiales bacterium]|jgi:hypothetical protein
MDWKREIITLTELPEARERKLDSTFFPALTKSEIADWERTNETSLPADFRSFYLESNGMEASRGELQAVLPLEQCQILPDGCERPVPWLEFGRSQTHRYFVSLGESQTIYRVAEFGSDEEFFARNLREYFANVFRGLN